MRIGSFGNSPFVNSKLYLGNAGDETSRTPTAWWQGRFDTFFLSPTGAKKRNAAQPQSTLMQMITSLMKEINKVKEDSSLSKSEKEMMLELLQKQLEEIRKQFEEAEKERLKKEEKDRLEGKKGPLTEALEKKGFQSIGSKSK